MNQFYNTRDLADRWLNVEGFQKSFTCLSYALEYWDFLLFDWG